MTFESRLEHAPGNEQVPQAEITAFRDRAVELFEDARQPFGRQDGVGSLESEPLCRVRYRSDEGHFVTIADSAALPFLPGVGPAGGSIAVSVETPLSPTPKLPNFYVEEKFRLAFGGQGEGYDYSLATNEYSSDGHYILSARTVAQVRKEYWGEMRGFPPECGRAHFTERLLMLIQLSAADEVGCEPNPYAR